MAQLPKNLWPETIHNVVWLKNKTSTCFLSSKTLYEVMHKVKLNLVEFLDWGTRVFTMKTNAGRLEAKSIEGC